MRSCRWHQINKLMDSTLKQLHFIFVEKRILLIKIKRLLIKAFRLWKKFMTESNWVFLLPVKKEKQQKKKIQRTPYKVFVYGTALYMRNRCGFHYRVGNDSAPDRIEKGFEKVHTNKKNRKEWKSRNSIIARCLVVTMKVYISRGWNGCACSLS